MLALEGENMSLSEKNVFINLNDCLISVRPLHNIHEIES